MSRKPINNEIRAILVSGYAWSGSSAIVDLLKEFETYLHFEPEFRLITDPGGIIDLENAIINSKSYTIINHTIKRFKNLIEIYRRDFHWWSNVKISEVLQKIGFNFNKYMSNDFKKISEDYLINLIDLEYEGDLITNFYDLNRFEFLFIKANYFIHKIVRKRMSSSHTIYFSSKSSDEFIRITKDYMDNICNAIIHKKDIKNLVFDQAVHPSNVLKGLKYFNSAKAIIVDRDPRDVFVQTYNFLYNTSIPNRNIEQFVNWYKLTRKNTFSNLESNKVMIIQFEDLILNYEEVITRIFDFLEEEPTIHVMKNKYLVPEVSKKNIGLWKKFKHQELINEIESRLKDFCRYN